jgi:hypothetical protein
MSVVVAGLGAGCRFMAGRPGSSILLCHVQAPDGPSLSARCQEGGRARLLPQTGDGLIGGASKHPG